MSTTKKTKSQFIADDKFCAECGSMLPLPLTAPSTIECVVCSARWPVAAIVNRFVYRIEHRYGRSLAESSMDATMVTESAAVGGADGPAVDRLCIACGHTQMAYTTRQTRSADEGMTVFYTCTKCRHRDIEYA